MGEVVEGKIGLDFFDVHFPSWRPLFAWPGLVEGCFPAVPEASLWHDPIDRTPVGES